MMKNPRNYIGNPLQLYGTRHYVLSEGSSHGMRAIDVNTGGGLCYTVLPDKGMDISLATYKGKNLTYLTPSLEVHPSYYEAYGSGWLRSFHAGLLTTCGLENVGEACNINGELYGLHGRRTVTPAVNVCDMTRYAGRILISGTIENSTLFSGKITCKRTIESAPCQNWLKITDEFENYGPDAAPFALLYHINFGYPFLNERTRISAEGDGPFAYDDYSANDIRRAGKFSCPNPALREKNYYYVRRDAAKYASAKVCSDESVCVGIRYRADALPVLNLWKMERPVDYVLAVEPSNVLCLGKRVLEEKGDMPVIEAGEKKITEIEIKVTEGE